MIGALPPVAASAWLYGVDTEPYGSVNGVVMVSTVPAGTTTIVNCR